MVDEQLAARGIVDPRVLDAFRRVPREKFIPVPMDPGLSARHAEVAYADEPVAIGLGQTISQPYIVALTAAALTLSGSERVLEVGTGSGYAAAILSLLAREVFTIERMPALAHVAKDRLARLGYGNVTVIEGDGTLGWQEHAPYDAIAVAAAGPKVPPPLLAQLAVGGRLVVPVGDKTQTLVRITRESAIRYREEELSDVRFVRLIGAEGFHER